MHRWNSDRKKCEKRDSGSTLVQWEQNKFDVNLFRLCWLNGTRCSTRIFLHRRSVHDWTVVTGTSSDVVARTLRSSAFQSVLVHIYCARESCTPYKHPRRGRYRWTPLSKRILNAKAVHTHRMYCRIDQKHRTEGKFQIKRTKRIAKNALSRVDKNG